MTFLHPGRLWLLLIVAAMPVAYAVVLRWRRAATIRFTQLDLLDQVVPRRPAWRRHVVTVFQLAGVAAGIVAVARPITTTFERTESDGRIVVLFDVSLSMAAEDVSPSRLASARRAAKDFIAQVADDIEVGLVSFSGVVTVEVQPTLDRLALESAVDALALDDSTAIGDALYTGTNLLLQTRREEAGDRDTGHNTVDGGGAAAGGETELAPGAIVLLSDGETTLGRPTSVGASFAAQSNVPVFTIAFGTPDGVIEDEYSGMSEPVPVRPGPLADTARATGGQAYEAATASELTDAYERIRTVLDDTLGEQVEVVAERTWVWASGAIASLTVAWLLGLWWLRGLV